MKWWCIFLVARVNRVNYGNSALLTVDLALYLPVFQVGTTIIHPVVNLPSLGITKGLKIWKRKCCNWNGCSFFYHSSFDYTSMSIL